MHTSLAPRLLSVLALAVSGSLLGCSGSPAPSDAGSRRDTGTMDDAASEFPDAFVAPGEDAFVAPGEDAFSAREDTGPATGDTGTALEDTGPQADTGPGASCGGRGSPPCPRGTFCNFPPSSICGRADGPGVCTPIPSACTREFVPVCGCDGMTYSNACEAQRASVSVETDGECPVRCDPETVVCDSIPPRCVSGQVPSVSAGCWTGDCVPIMECTCETFADCPDIRGVSEACYTRGVCGPLL